ncbi:MAG TPA: serine/threonine-protein kinase [Gemmatimonadales bacterium]
MTRADDLLWRRWGEVDPLLDAALDLPPESRASYVRRAAGDDLQLRDLLLRLLERLESEQPGATAPSPGVLAAAFPEEEPPGADLEPGAQVGRYVVLDRRGRGGMATVYEAERSDGVYRQRVALKVLRRGLDTEDLVRRFLTERQILSSLAHPNIARLLDGGSTPDGRPFLVMELVDGEPITAYADARRLGIAERLELVLAVADAVSAAHRQLVVHRDIKPSNILVDPDGRVRLLDFGIAKLLVEDGQATEVGVRVLTPDYASPEQLRGEPITTATDVYQLGLLLRELLTGLPAQAGGRRPGDPLTRPSRAAQQHVAGCPEPETRALGRAMTSRRLARALRGELDIIVGKALRPEPGERYASADELASDLRRYLAHRPILAHPESARYRLGKFLGRHPAFFPVLVAVLVALGTFIVVLAGQNRRLERQRDLAAAALSRAQETQRFFVDLFRSPDPWAPADPERGRDITVLEALRLGTRRVQEELREQPELRAALLSTIGSVLLSLDQPAEAREVLEKAVSVRHTLGGLATVEASDDLGRLGTSLDALNLRDSAQRVLTRRLELERAREPTDSARLSQALRDLAVSYWQTGPLSRAVALLEEAVRVLRGTDGELHPAFRQLSDYYREVERLEESESVAREALARAERRRGPDDPATAEAAHNLAKTLGARNRTADATALFQRALGHLERRLGPDHAYTLEVRNDLGVLLMRVPDYHAAEGVFREVLASNRRKHGGDTHAGVADALQNLAAALLNQERLEEAEPLTRQAEAIYRRVLPAGSYIVAFPMLSRAEIQLRRGAFSAAAKTAAAAAAVLRGRVPDHHPAAIVADCRLGRARAELGQLDEARDVLASVRRRLRSAEGVRESHRAECLAALARAGRG